MLYSHHDGVSRDYHTLLQRSTCPFTPLHQQREAQLNWVLSFTMIEIDVTTICRQKRCKTSTRSTERRISSQSTRIAKEIQRYRLGAYHWTCSVGPWNSKIKRPGPHTSMVEPMPPSTSRSICFTSESVTWMNITRTVLNSALCLIFPLDSPKSDPFLGRSDQSQYVGFGATEQWDVIKSESTTVPNNKIRLTGCAWCSGQADIHLWW